MPRVETDAQLLLRHRRAVRAVRAAERAAEAAPSRKDYGRHCRRAGWLRYGQAVIENRLRERGLAAPVAALYVCETGYYADHVGVDPWPLARDATKYGGPWPVVAHPPCGHWGAYGHKAHDDGSTGPVAVRQVRQWGGVLEHPAGSRLWAECRLPVPGRPPDAHGGYTVEVNQHDWGHPALKPTWLYVVGCPDLPARPPLLAPPEAPPTPGLTRGILERLSKRQRSLTPLAFADWLVTLARSCG